MERPFLESSSQADLDQQANYLKTLNGYQTYKNPVLSFLLSYLFPPIYLKFLT